jgi:hypothetical protein
MQATPTTQLRFNGQLYQGSTLRMHPPYTWVVARIPVEHMREIGTGVIPAADTRTSPRPDRSVVMAVIDGVDLETAVAWYPADLVYVRSTRSP